MKANIKILTRDCCDKLLTFSNDQTLRSAYNDQEFESSRLSFLNAPSKHQLDTEFFLRSKPKDDCRNSINLFKQLQNLDRVQANDKRLWVSLTHSVLFKYTKERWDINSHSSDATIISRFHFEGNGLEGRMRNAVSRLWWAAKITYDEIRDNPFELTELLWEKQDIITSLVERSFGTYKNVLHGFLEFYKRNRHLKENDIRILAKGLNAIGGVKVLPVLGVNGVLEELKRVSSFSKINFH